MSVCIQIWLHLQIFSEFTKPYTNTIQHDKMANLSESAFRNWQKKKKNNNNNKNERKKKKKKKKRKKTKMEKGVNVS